MSYPPLNDIISAAKDSKFIKDTFFLGSSVKILSTGRPEMYGGGFSQVFPILKGKEKWAFKVWHREINNNKERYKKIAEHLYKCNLPYFSEFTYVENGLIVTGEFLDTLRMKWVEGLKLTEYISYHLHDNYILEKLAANFLTMIDDLHKNSISHGDLQHNNILVTQEGEIKLIDYDSICVPALEGERDVCRGRFGFQHPSRITAGIKASVKVDYFSELVIYLSILAVAENPTLWDKYKVAVAEDRLLFKAEDFLDWEYSALRQDLILLSTRVNSLIIILENYLGSHLLLLPFTS
jgi:serine/threonine protein kinase